MTPLGVAADRVVVSGSAGTLKTTAIPDGVKTLSVNGGVLAVTAPRGGDVYEASVSAASARAREENFRIAGARQPDAVCTVNFTVDVHAPTEKAAATDARNVRTKPYQIPRDIGVIFRFRERA